MIRASTQADLADLERTRDVRRRELDVLEAQVTDARRAFADLDAVWRANAQSGVPLGPVLASLVSLVMANAAAFFGWIIVADHCRNQIANGLYLAALVFALIGARFATKRLGLRHIALTFAAISVFEVLYAVWTLEGSRH